MSSFCFFVKCFIFFLKIITTSNKILFCFQLEEIIVLDSDDDTDYFSQHLSNEVPVVKGEEPENVEDEFNFDEEFERQKSGEKFEN